MDDISSRNENGRGIARRGAAVAVESARDIDHIMCYNYSGKGHFTSTALHLPIPREGGTAVTAGREKTKSNQGPYRTEVVLLP